VKNENHGLEKLGGLNPLKCLQSDVGKVWGKNGWCIAKFGDFGILALFCDLVKCGVKNENHGFGNVA